MRCENCKYARKACNEDYVGCVAMLSEKEDYSNNEKAFRFYERDSLNTGWVYLSCDPNCENSNGIMTNGIPCFLKDDHCKHYQANSNITKKE